MRYPKECYAALERYEKKTGRKLKGKARKNFLRNLYTMMIEVKKLCRRRK